MYRSFTQLQVRFLCTFRYEVNDVQVFIGRNSVLKALSPFRNWFLEVKSTFLLHSNSQKVSLVSRCDSFDVLTVLTAFVLFNESNHLPILKGDWLIKCVLWERRTRWRQSGSLENKVCFENLIFSKALKRRLSTQQVKRNTRLRLVFPPTLLSYSIPFLRALQQNRAESRLLYLLLEAS